MSPPQEGLEVADLIPTPAPKALVRRATYSRWAPGAARAPVISCSDSSTGLPLRRSRYTTSGASSSSSTKTTLGQPLSPNELRCCVSLTSRLSRAPKADGRRARFSSQRREGAWGWQSVSET